MNRQRYWRAFYPLLVAIVALLIAAASYRGKTAVPPSPEPVVTYVVPAHASPQISLEHSRLFSSDLRFPSL